MDSEQNNNASQTRLGGYSTKEVAGLIGLKSSQVRHYVRRGILDPGRDAGGKYRFRFQDIVLLRTAKGLMDANVSARDVHRSLRKLQVELKSVKSLASVRVFADGGNVVVGSEQQIWNVESGQGHLNFSVRELADNVADLANNHMAAAVETDELSSDEWYNLGLDLEEVDVRKAPECYRRALQLDPENADAHVNLGRLFQLEGDIRQAKQHYESALSVVGEHPLAHYNIGTIFDELDELDRAADHYRMAPEVADAHFNLSRIFKLTGDEVSSQRHMQRYRQLLGQADWMEDEEPPEEA